MPAPDPADVATLLALELALAGRDESAIPGGYAAALEAGFVEFGQSGRVWTRADTLEALAAPARPATLRIEGFEAVELAGDVVLVTYDLVGPRAGASPSRSRRSSIWQRRDGRWRMRFHQGTRVEGWGRSARLGSLASPSPDGSVRTMTRSLLEDAFAHHAWATVRLLDACLALTPAQLDTTVMGTYGSILETMRHLVGADCAYLSVLSGGRVAEIEEAGMDLAGLRDAMAANGPAWSAYLATDPDPEAVVVRLRDDGSESHAPAGIRLAQALHHGTDHRSQVCTTLTQLGIEPPAIDAWDFADQAGRLADVPAPA